MAQTELNADSRLTIPAPVMSRLVGDETVLLDLESGMYFGLEGVGKRIWESIAVGNTLGETAAIIAGEFKVEETQALADLIEFSKNLLERGLLETK